MASIASFWLDGVQQRLRWTFLHADRFPRHPCAGRFDLAFDRVCVGQARTIFAGASCGSSDLRHVLDLCRRSLAGSLWFGLSLLRSSFDSQATLRYFSATGDYKGDEKEDCSWTPRAMGDVHAEPGYGPCLFGVHYRRQRSNGGCFQLEHLLSDVHAVFGGWIDCGLAVLSLSEIASGAR